MADETEPIVDVVARVDHRRADGLTVDSRDAVALAREVERLTLMVPGEWAKTHERLTEEREQIIAAATAEVARLRERAEAAESRVEDLTRKVGMSELARREDTAAANDRTRISESRATTAEQERDAMRTELMTNRPRLRLRAALAEERARADRLAACMEIRWGAPPNDDLYAVVVTADAPDALDDHCAARAALATCGSCGGSGGDPLSTLDPDPASSFHGQPTAPCPDCAGTGRAALATEATDG